ncbi:uncharacterized protein [Typha angustifolia]|uniref:uncharacterized protein n=1 Tax=Typha angustifolia TaxID=59011 RepID=UPI003C2C0B6E
MDDSTPCSETDVKDTYSASWVSSHLCFESLHVEDKSSSCNMKNVANMIPLEVVSASVWKTEEVVEQSEGASSGGHVPYIHGQHYVLNAAFDQDETVNLEEIKISKDFSSSVSLDGKKKKDLKKCATFPCSAEVHEDISSSDGHDSLPSIDIYDSNAVGNPAFERSMSFPTSMKLVSAMKGGRAQNGIPPTVKLHVKWAPEVYDPPTTTMSHTVKKYHQQRPKSKKKNHKQKHKSKSSRGGNERRHMNQSCIDNATLPPDTRLQAAGDKILLDGYGKSNAEMLEYGIGSQESKCGSSFMREALGNMHFSTAEAS